MKCSHAKQAIESLVFGEETDCDAILEHFSKCSRCRNVYEPFLPIIRSAKSVVPPPVDAESWREFSAKLNARLEKEQPSLGFWRSFILWMEQRNLVRFQKVAATTLAALALIVGAVVFSLSLVPDRPVKQEVVRRAPVPVEAIVLPLPPEVADVISVFGPDGFVTGVFSGYIRPGDFFGGHELLEDDIVEALDYLLS